MLEEAPAKVGRTRLIEGVGGERYDTRCVDPTDPGRSGAGALEYFVQAKWRRCRDSVPGCKVVKAERR